MSSDAPIKLDYARTASPQTLVRKFLNFAAALSIVVFFVVIYCLAGSARFTMSEVPAVIIVVLAFCVVLGTAIVDVVTTGWSLGKKVYPLLVVLLVA